MAKITKLDAAQRQLDAAIRMFFKNEDMIAVHTVSRAAFRIVWDITAEADKPGALAAHIKKVGHQKFNEETNFFKHADQDPEAEIDENFHTLTEAGIGMGIGLYTHHIKKLTPEMKGFLMWSQFMHPELFDLPEDLAKDINDWKAASRTDPNKIEGQANNRAFGDAIVHWCRIRMAPS